MKKVKIFSSENEEEIEKLVALYLNDKNKEVKDIKFCVYYDIDLIKEYYNVMIIYEELE